MPAAAHRAISFAAIGVFGAVLAASSAAAQEVTDNKSQHRVERARAGAPYHVDTIRVDSADAAPLTRFSDLLTGRSPGLLVQRANGTPASSARYRLRGVRSPSASNDPLVIVDGIRLSDEAAFQQLTGGVFYPVLLPPAPLSRLDMLDPEHSVQVEVLSGPAATALLGAGGSNGALLLTTRGGTPGRARWSAHTTFGAAHDATDYPANFVQIGVLPDGGREPNCPLLEQALKQCTALTDSLMRSAPLMQESPFGTGTRSELGIGLSAGGERGSVYAGAGYARELGVFSVDRTRRTDLRTNAQLRLRPDLDLVITGGYVDGAVRAPSTAYPGILLNGLIGYFDGRTGDSGPGYLIAPDSMRRQPASSEFGRVIAGATLGWRPLAWLATATMVGVDHAQVTRADSATPSYADTYYVQIGRDTSRQTTTTLRSVVTASFGFSPSLRVSTTLGGEYRRERANSSGWLMSGISGSAGPPLTEGTGQRASLRGSTTALLAQTQLGWRERVYVTGGVRHELLSATNVLDNRRSETELYPSAGVSWNVSDESWFPSRSPIATLRLRGAYGVSGQRGSLEVERTREHEFGLDASAIGGRVALELTLFRQKTANAGILVRTAYGGYNEFQARVQNSGLEAMIHTSLISGQNLAWDVTFAGATLENRAAGDLGPVSDQFVYITRQQRIRAGYPLAGYWDRPILGYADLDGDGLIGIADCLGYVPGPMCEVALGDTAVYLGSPLPKRRLSIAPRVSYRRWLTLTALLDHHGGVKQLNNTALIRCKEFVCREQADRSTSLADQVRFTAARLGSYAGYIEDASFWKLREVAVQLHAPERWARAMSATRLTVTLAGRNLATWTRYSGFDPEVTSYEMSPLIRTDNFAQPAARYFLARLDVGW